MWKIHISLFILYLMLITNSIIFNKMFVFKYTKGLLCDGLTLVKSMVGRSLREAGLEIDGKGSRIQRDIAYLEPYNRHRNILHLYQQHPQISQSAYIASNATVIGDVFIGQNSYMGFGSVAHGQGHPVRIGSNTKIGENTVLQTNLIGNDQAYPLSVNIGNDVNIQNNCYLMSCIVDDDVHIGHRSTVMEGSQLQRGCVIAPNSYVPAGSRIPAHTLWAGVPVVFVKNLEQVNQTSKIKEQSKEQIRISQN